MSIANKNCSRFSGVIRYVCVRVCTRTCEHACVQGDDYVHFFIWMYSVKHKWGFKARFLGKFLGKLPTKIQGKSIFYNPNLHPGKVQFTVRSFIRWILYGILNIHLKESGNYFNLKWVFLTKCRDIFLVWKKTLLNTGCEGLCKAITGDILTVTDRSHPTHITSKPLGVYMSLFSRALLCVRACGDFMRKHQIWARFYHWECVETM